MNASPLVEQTVAMVLNLELVDVFALQVPTVNLLLRVMGIKVQQPGEERIKVL